MHNIKKKNLAILFLGSLVPNTPEFQNPGVALSGMLVQEGLVDGFLNQDLQVDILSSQPIPSFPNYNTIICKRRKISYKDRSFITTLPAINIIVIREIMKGIAAFFEILIWALKNFSKKRCIIIYGVYSPPLPFVYLIGKITKTKTVSILYDLGIPPKSLKLGKLRTVIYYAVDFFAKIIIPHLDGRIVINENIVTDYAPKKHYLLIDGAVNNSVISKLFDLKLKNINKDETIFLCAGALWPINGTQIIIDAMKINKNQNIKVWFAGKGIDLQIIRQAEEYDKRIKYLGMLDLDELFSYYQKADVLMNIRVTEEAECRYLFPSKFFEYLVTGKYIITTQVAHLERLYGHLCFVLHENSPQILAQAMEIVTNLPKGDLIKRGRKAREFMLENRTWDIQSNKIIDYLDREVF